MDSAKERSPTPEFTFSDDGGRPILKIGSIRPKFRPNDKVWFFNLEGQRTGPYLVSEVVDGWYRLSDQQQVAVNNNQWVEESDLKLVESTE